MNYTRGTFISLQTSFLVSGTYADPSYVSLLVQSPSRATVGYYYLSGTITREAEGIYGTIIQATESGQWWYYWYGSGTVYGTDEGWFMVDLTAFEDIL